MKKRWAIIFATSVPPLERSHFATELVDRLKVELDGYQNNTTLTFSEVLPISLSDITQIISAKDIESVSVDARFEVQIILQSDVKMIMTKGSYFEIKLNRITESAERQIEVFDEYLKMPC